MNICFLFLLKVMTIDMPASVEEIKEALNFAGLEFVTVYDAFTRNEPNSESERIYVVARECQKNQVSK